MKGIQPCLAAGPRQANSNIRMPLSVGGGPIIDHYTMSQFPHRVQNIRQKRNDQEIRVLWKQILFRSIQCVTVWEESV